MTMPATDLLPFDSVDAVKTNIASKSPFILEVAVFKVLTLEVRLLLLLVTVLDRLEIDVALAESAFALVVASALIAEPKVLLLPVTVEVKLVILVDKAESALVLEVASELIAELKVLLLLVTVVPKLLKVLAVDE